MFLDLHQIDYQYRLFQDIYYEIIHQLNQEENINIDTFITHKSPEISQVITDILMDDEKHSLSDWSRKKIYPKSKTDVLSKLVTDAILNLRRILIEQKIKALQIDVKETPQAQILENVLNYTRLKKLLFEKLNRVV